MKIQILQVKIVFRIYKYNIFLWIPMFSCCRFLLHAVPVRAVLAFSCLCYIGCFWKSLLQLMYIIKIQF